MRLPRHPADPSELGPPAALTGRKAEIREAALTLFSERGYHGTGMEDIARLVGIRASSLYNHVSSKQLLLADIMSTTMRELLLRFDEAVAVAGPADPRTGLRLAMEAHVRYHGVHRRDVRIGNREIASLQEPHQLEVRELRRSYARRWQTLIENGVACGAFSTPSPQLSTYALLEMGIGVSQWFHEDGPLSLDEIAGHYGTMALRQLGVADETVADQTVADQTVADQTVAHKAVAHKAEPKPARSRRPKG